MAPLYVVSSVLRPVTVGYLPIRYFFLFWMEYMMTAYLRRGRPYPTKISRVIPAAPGQGQRPMTISTSYMRNIQSNSTRLMYTDLGYTTKRRLLAGKINWEPAYSSENRPLMNPMLLRLRPEIISGKSASMSLWQALTSPNSTSPHCTFHPILAPFPPSAIRNLAIGKD